MLPTKYLSFLELFLINLYRRANYHMTGYRIMLPQSSKKGDQHSPANYRPISLTCVCAKLLEHIICKQIMSHFSKNKISTPVQHGFRSKHSCESQFLITTDELIQNFGGQMLLYWILVRPLTLSLQNSSYTNSTTTEFGEQLLIGFKIS